MSLSDCEANDSTADRNDVSDQSISTNDTETITCKYCQTTFDSEHARSIHEGRQHDSSSTVYGNGDYRDRDTLVNAYERHDGNVAAVARTLGCAFDTARRWCIKHDVGRYASDSDSTESSHDRVCSNGKQTQHGEEGDE